MVRTRATRGGDDGGTAVDLVFIDGMHLFEYALRDFMNVEKHSRWGSVIVLDDMLPRIPVEGVRDRDLARSHGAWAGDVYKVVDALRSLRPDLLCLEIDTQPTGTAVVLLPDSSSTSLAAAYDDLAESYAVPEAVLSRSRALDPVRLLEAPIWDELRRLRELPDAEARPQVAGLLAGAGLATPR